MTLCLTAVKLWCFKLCAFFSGTPSIYGSHVGLNSTVPVSCIIRKVLDVWRDLLVKLYAVSYSQVFTSSPGEV